MLSLRRFRKLSESYGAYLERWPAEVRREAMILLKESRDARVILEEMRSFDAAIAAATEREDQEFWQAGEQAAALARLRAGVGARIASSPIRPHRDTRGFGGLAGGINWPFVPKLRWIGLTASSTFAIMFGLMIGATSTQPPPTDNVFAMLQPAPIQILADQYE